MEYNSKMIGSYVSPGTEEGKTGITHFLIQAKQTIYFNEEEAEKLKHEIFSVLKDYNCLVFSNFKGVDVIEEEIIETSIIDDPKIEKTRRELSNRIVETTTSVFQKLEEKLD